MMGSEEKGIDITTLKPEHQIAVEVLTGICNCMEQNAYPVVRDVQGAYLNIEIMGDDMRSTYGRLGASLDALQLLSNTIVARRTRGDVRVILDAGGYRERRIETLTERALEMAKAVKEHNQEAEMEPLPPHERRIIHTILMEDPDIRTFSEGEEPNRRIVVSPR